MSHGEGRGSKISHKKVFRNFPFFQNSLHPSGSSASRRSTTACSSSTLPATSSSTAPSVQSSRQPSRNFSPGTCNAKFHQSQNVGIHCSTWQWFSTADNFLPELAISFKEGIIIISLWYRSLTRGPWIYGYCFRKPSRLKKIKHYSTLLDKDWQDHKGFTRIFLGFRFQGSTEPLRGLSI